MENLVNSVEEAWDRLRDSSHMDHEYLIRYLQDHPDPRSVAFLRQAISLKPQLEYLEYDDYGAYYKKCLWALQVINTVESIALIRECSESPIVELMKQAKYRLSKIQPATAE